MSMAPEAASAVGKAQPLKFHGGKGKDTVVFDGSVGDAKIAENLSKVVAGGLNAKLKKIELWQFDDYIVKAHRFEAALTNLDGKSKIKGDVGHELIVGHKAGRDHLIADGGKDTLLGLGGHDRLKAGQGKDHLDGGDGNDLLKGHAGDDRLIGGDGDDRLVGGAGRNNLEGGLGVDAFVLDGKGTSKKHDVIIGYEAGEKIVIDADVLAGLVGPGPLEAKYFQVGPKAAGHDHHVILDTGKDRLLFDKNGDKKGGVTTLAEFRNGALPDAGDIVVA
jgi:Ca2+-binding RTX toxin-like protein